MRDGTSRAYLKVMAEMLAVKLAISVIALVTVAILGLLAESASAQSEDAQDYEPISSQGGAEETTESVVGNIADGRDESTMPVEGSGDTEPTQSTMEDSSVDESGLSKSSFGQQSTQIEPTLPEASPGPPLTESTMPATAPGGAMMEPTSPATGLYEDATPLPGATPDSGGLSMTAAFMAPLLLGIGLIGSAFLIRGRSSGEEVSSDED